MSGSHLFKDQGLYVKSYESEISPEEVILDSYIEKRQEEGLGDQRMELPLSQNVLRVFFALFLFVSLVFVGKTFHFQVLSKDQWTLLAKDNVERKSLIVPERGIIYDRNFVQLVSNEPSFDFVCDKRDMPPDSYKRELSLRIVSSITGIDFEEFKQMFNETVKPEVLLVQDLSQEQLVVLEARAADFPGCAVQEHTKRQYRDGAVFAHALGYTAKISQQELEARQEYTPLDKIGKEGVEYAYEHILRGVPGVFVVEKDALGAELNSAKEQDPIPGSNVVLHLDAKLQEKIAQALQDSMSRIGATRASAVALDPNTGGVLALVSLPSFDANKFSEGISVQDWNALLNDPHKPLFNRAISGIGFPTGSVIKPFIALAGLQEGVIGEYTVLPGPLELCVENKFTKEKECFRDWTYHGDSDVKRAIAESVNPFFYIVGGGFEKIKGLGPLKIKEYLEKFRWGSLIGIDIPGEGTGILPTIDSSWRLGDTYHFSIGQGAFAATPLQVAVATSVIANGGILFKPQLAKSIVDSRKNVVQEFSPVALQEHIASRENIETVREGMRRTVSNGSASGWLNTFPTKSGAKTGTAQTGRKTADGKDYLYSWTAAFAPYENPQIVLVVVVEDVIEGQIATLPVARDVFQWYFAQ